MLSIIETPRLLLRPFQPDDAYGIFQMDTDPKVMHFLGGVRLKTSAEAIQTVNHVIQQYEERGIGRYTVIEKDTGDYVGWSGLKLEKSDVEGYEKYYDLGYRLLQKHWGKGYATESAIASVEFGFDTLQLSEILGRVFIQHQASQNVLHKAGLRRFMKINATDFFYRITKKEYQERF